MYEIIVSFMTIKVLYIVTCTSFTQPVRRDELINLSTGTSLFRSGRNMCLYNVVHKSISKKSLVQTEVFLLFLMVLFLHDLKDLKTSVAIITLTTKNIIHPFISTLWTYCQFISFTNFNAQFLYSLTICMLHYNPRHISSISMPIFRRTKCIITASVIVTLCKRMYCTESDNTRCFDNTICPPEDGHANARNMSRIVM
jgi:hypothetical protein